MTAIQKFTHRLLPKMPRYLWLAFRRYRAFIEVKASRRSPKVVALVRRHHSIKYRHAAAISAIFQIISMPFQLDIYAEAWCRYYGRLPKESLFHFDWGYFKRAPAIRCHAHYILRCAHADDADDAARWRAFFIWRHGFRPQYFSKASPQPPPS